MKPRFVARRRALALLALACFAGRIAAAAPPKPREVKWVDLSALVTGHKIATVLPDGARIEGKVRSVEPDALLVDIQKTSDRSAHPKGRAAIPSSSVSELRVIRLGRYRGRVIGTAIGAGGGIALAYLLAEGVFHFSGEGGATPERKAAVAGVAIGFSALGYWVGRDADRGITHIRVIPESPARSTQP
jgi:hypothetical protein